MKKARGSTVLAVIVLCCFFWAAGCISVEPEIAGTPTPSSSPTPMPEAFAPELTAAPLPTDQLGKIVETDDHYYSYLSFGDVRVYEYDTGTFLDGICVNAYPQALEGELYIVYYAADGKLAGKGRIHNATGGNIFETGSHPVYAEISTDISVIGMDFVFEVKTPFVPVVPEQSEKE